MVVRVSRETGEQVVLYCFDCLYLDGDVMLRRPLLERREALYQAIIPEEGKIQFATQKTSRDLEELQARLRTSRVPLRCVSSSGSILHRCMWCDELNMTAFALGLLGETRSNVVFWSQKGHFYRGCITASLWRSGFPRRGRGSLYGRFDCQDTRRSV
jgi:hypothetical protein